MYWRRTTTCPKQLHRCHRYPPVARFEEVKWMTEFHNKWLRGPKLLPKATCWVELHCIEYENESTGTPAPACRCRRWNWNKNSSLFRASSKHSRPLDTLAVILQLFLCRLLSWMMSSETTLHLSDEAHLAYCVDGMVDENAKPVLKKVFQLRGSSRPHKIARVATPVFPC